MLAGSLYLLHGLWHQSRCAAPPHAAFSRAQHAHTCGVHAGCDRFVLGLGGGTQSVMQSHAQDVNAVAGTRRECGEQSPRVMRGASAASVASAAAAAAAAATEEMACRWVGQD